MESTDMECPAYTETKTDESPPPPYRSEEAYQYELEVYDGIQNYYYGGQNDGNVSLSPSLKWRQYILPLVYIITLSTATLLHRNILKENNVPYFLTAVYNTITVVLAVSGIVYNSYRQAGAIQDVENPKSVGGKRQNQSDHWKPFAFIFLYMASEEGFWFSLSSMDLLGQRITYLTYPLFAALFTWEWVFAGKKERMVKGIKKRDMERFRMAVAVGGLGVVWSYRTSFEWWGCMVGVAILGFKNVVTRDILMTSSRDASELVMLAGSAVSFRALMSCYGSAEYSLIWPQLMAVSWQCCAKVLVVGICYGIAQLVSVEMGRVWEPVKGSWMVTGSAVVGGLGCLVWGV
ncbi:hypothetical protein TWF506_007113 [Arthrobotrys conoides]|uniref:Uncharacterized protein n=1 Tax=Arthrobotrys conoides TaxID=74498 RepID=A0AAN8NE01_9PEZI